MSGSGVTATIDRFEGERGRIAVLVEEFQAPEPGGESSRRKVNVDRSLLPEGAHEGDVIRLSRSLGDGGEETARAALEGARIDHRATEARRNRVEDRIERLKDRGERP